MEIQDFYFILDPSNVIGPAEIVQKAHFYTTIQVNNTEISMVQLKTESNTKLNPWHPEEKDMPYKLNNSAHF